MAPSSGPLSSLVFVSLCVFSKVSTIRLQKGPKEGVDMYWGHKFALERSSPLKHMCFTIRMELGHLENSLLHLMNSLL